MVAGFSNPVLIPHFFQENRICLCSRITLLSLLFEIFSYEFVHLEGNNVFFPTNIMNLSLDLF